MKPKRHRHEGPMPGRIARLREAKGLTQEQLAIRCDVDKTTVSHWETGLRRPDISRLPKLARELDVSVDDLLRGEKAA